MKFGADGCAKLGLAVLAVAGWASPPRSEARPAQLRGAPVRPIAEGWAEVVSVTNKWLVIQNERGQQFPIAFDAINMFFIRWPTTPARVSPEALVEATGFDSGSMQLVTDHVDVYEGSARGLVAPTFLAINGAGNLRRPIDYVFDAQVYGEPFPGIAPPIQGGLPVQAPQIHVVGPLVGVDPLRISTRGGNPVVVVPTGDSVSMTQITPGSLSYLRPGDTVYFLASAMAPKSLNLAQLVAYKKVPLN